jgi:hypothetical protein
MAVGNVPFFDDRDVVALMRKIVRKQLVYPETMSPVLVERHPWLRNESPPPVVAKRIMGGTSP